MTRRMSRTRRAAIFAAHKGVCHICKAPIDGVRERWDAEHIIPLNISGDDSDGNLAPAHAGCHRDKTKDDAADIAKCKRVAAKHTGSWRPKSTLPGSRDGNWKQKIGGQWVRRNEGG